MLFDPRFAPIQACANFSQL